MGIRIDLDKCTGCGNCVTACPFVLIEIIDEKARINEGCTFCGACLITMPYSSRKLKNLWR